ncbi:MAG TPA: alanine racemase [Longimicrobiales bacterium]
MSNGSRARAWAEIDLAALRANFQVVRERAATAKGVLPMVKANAYGLGVEAVVDALEPLDPWGYGVATVAEGRALRALDVSRPILVATPIPPGEEDAAVDAELTAGVSDLDALRRLAAAAQESGATVDFHVDVDTGMGRSGFPADDVASWAPALLDAAGPLRCTGAYTHFHSADEGDGRAPTDEQVRRFEAALAALPVARAQLVVHVANSAAAVRWPELAFDLVRPGIFLYGGRIAPAGSGAPEPRPVVSIHARLSHVRDVPPGTTAGYGATYAAAKAERWGTAAIGYGDGLSRALAKGGGALVGGRRVPMRGRISMDSVVLDVSGVPGVQAGDVATFVGADGGESIALEDVAAAMGTISYEVLTRMGERLERVYLDEA